MGIVLKLNDRRVRRRQSLPPPPHPRLLSVFVCNLGPEHTRRFARNPAFLEHIIRSFHLLGDPGVGAGEAQRTKGQGRKTKRKATQRFAATPLGTGLPSHPSLQGVLEWGTHGAPPLAKGCPWRVSTALPAAGARGRKEDNGTADGVLRVTPARGRGKRQARETVGDTVPEAGSLLPCTCFRQEKGKNTARDEKPTCQKQRKKEL